jgi:hypothetical protein
VRRTVVSTFMGRVAFLNKRGLSILRPRRDVKDFHRTSSRFEQIFPEPEFC